MAPCRARKALPLPGSAPTAAKKLFWRDRVLARRSCVSRSASLSRNASCACWILSAFSCARAAPMRSRPPISVLRPDNAVPGLAAIRLPACESREGVAMPAPTAAFAPVSPAACIPGIAIAARLTSGRIVFALSPIRPRPPRQEKEYSPARWTGRSTGRCRPAHPARPASPNAARFLPPYSVAGARPAHRRRIW